MGYGVQCMYAFDSIVLKETGSVVQSSLHGGNEGYLAGTTVKLLPLNRACIKLHIRDEWGEERRIYWGVSLS